jgi:hypothetical protein
VSDLTDALDDLLRAHAEIGSPLRSCIRRPGPSDAAIRSAFAAIGVSPSVEVMEWFEWGEPDQTSWTNAGAIGSVSSFWFGYPMSVAEAVRTHGEFEGDFGWTTQSTSDPEWRSTWLPILWGSPAVYVADCTDPGRVSTPVRRTENRPTDGPAAPEIFPSLVALVRAASRQVRTLLMWDGESLQPKGDLPRIEDT